MPRHASNVPFADIDLQQREVWLSPTADIRQADRTVWFVLQTGIDPEHYVGIARNHHGTGVTRGLPFSSMKALYAFAGVSPVFFVSCTTPAGT